MQLECNRQGTVVSTPGGFPKVNQTGHFHLANPPAGGLGALVSATWDLDNKLEPHVCMPVLTIHMLCMYLCECM